MSNNSNDERRRALEATLARLNDAIREEQQRWNQMSPGPNRDAFWTTIREIVAERDAIERRLLREEFESDEFRQALARLRAIAAENTRVARHMPAFTGWLNTAGDVLGLAQNAVEAVNRLP